MPLSAAFSALLILQAAAAPPAPPSFQNAMIVAEPIRLALTPKLDGNIDDEEWDPLVSSPVLKGYFQWEPEKLHFAGVTPNGNDLLISIDFASRGWLVGPDHVEARVSMASGTPTLAVRRLDATPVSGPRWVDLPGMHDASSLAAKSDGTNTTYELTLCDAGLGLCPAKDRSRISLRMDAIPSATPPIDPFIPRVLSPLQLEYSRGAALPNGLRFAVENSGAAIAAGEESRLRFTFNGANTMNLKRLALRGEGYGRDLAEMAVPFPPFDDKGRAFVDYNCQVPRGEDAGFRVVRGTITGSDGLTGLLEASFRIAPPLDIELVRKDIRSRSQTQIVHLAYYVKSNSRKRISGISSVEATGPVSLAKPEADKFTVDGPRSSVRMGFDLTIPGGTRGAIPLKFTVDAGKSHFESVGYVNIQ